jgi:cytochrome c oxidase subunit 2
MSTTHILGVAAILALAGTASNAARQPVPTGPSRIVEVTAERFEFWPSEITMAEHESIEIRVRSEDTVHGFRILGTGTHLVVPKRGKGEVTATLSGLAPGRYTFECSRMCGAGHHFMRGVLVVRPSGETR